MFDGPIRGGTRGGQGEFKWSDVSADKDRENYLGHSINAPTGRWQKNKDVHWYNRDVKTTEAERLEEIRKIKETEEEALAVALGYKPAVQPATGTEPPASSEDGAKPRALEDPATFATKEEKRRRKDERRKQKDEKRERKELKRLQRLARGSVKGEHRQINDENFSDDEYDTLGRHPRHPSLSRSRSRSPRRPRRNKGRTTSRTPSRDNGGYRNRDARSVERDGYSQGTRKDRRLDDSGYERDRRAHRL